MNAALVRKTLRDSLPLLLLGLVALLLFETMFVIWIKHLAATALRFLSELPFVAKLVETFLGADLTKENSSTALASVGLGHALVYVVSWTILLAASSRVLAGETDRGTADLLFTLPLSRSRIYFSVSFACGLLILPLALCLPLGLRLGQWLFALAEPIHFGRLAPVLANLMALHAAILGTSLAFSAAAERRGSPIGWTAGYIVFSFVLNFIEAIAPWADRIGFLGLFHYYQPLRILQDGGWPLTRIAALLSLALTAWLLGWWRFTRRDVPAP